MNSDRENNNNYKKDEKSDEITPVSLEQEMRKSYLDYAMSVVVSRALPDLRDGLKPVHRRILYSMHESSYNYNKPYRKSARIVGDVMGKYHPHGDQAIYDSLVRMAQNFSMRHMLIDGQGNFGSMDGDPPAAMRYTEARLSKISESLVDDLDKETVNFQANYDETALEPLVLPAKFPNLLVNGAGGIAVGMATNIPPHNLGEVIDATIKLIDHKFINKNDISIEELNKIIKGPDFPTGGIIVGKKGIINSFETGKGSNLIRSKISIEDLNKNSKSLIVHEIPYLVNKSRLLEKIAETVDNKIIEGISDIRDESDRKGLRIVIELKKDFSPEIILNQLYKHTPLQSTFSSNVLALNKGKPQQLNLKQILEFFIIFRKEIVTKRISFDLKKAREKAHILIGLYVANIHLDKILEIIKSSKDSKTARDLLKNNKWKISKEFATDIKLINKNEQIDNNLFIFSESQTKAILDLRLHRLTSIERNEISKDLKDIIKEISGYLEILNSEKKLLENIKNELILVKNEFSTVRKTEIIEEEQNESDLNDINYVQKEDIVVTVSHRGYMKRVPLDTYKVQKKGGKGRTGMSIRDNDFVSQIFVVTTHTKLLIFSSFGKVYSLRSFDIPEGNPNSRGKPIINMLPFKNDEIISAVVPLPIDEKEWEKLYIMFATKFGMVRKNRLIDVAKSGQRSLRDSGKTAIKLKKDDKLISVLNCDDNFDALLSTTDGKCIRFQISKIRLISTLNSQGVRGIKLKGSNKVISMCILNHSPIDISIRKDYLKFANEMRKNKSNKNIKEDFIKLNDNEEFILSITNKGYGKKSSAYEYRITSRGGSGITGILTTNKNGKVLDSFIVNENDEIILVTNGGKLIRVAVKDVRIAGRSTQGVTIFKIPQEEQIVSVSKVNSLNE